MCGFFTEYIKPLSLFYYDVSIAFYPYYFIAYSNLHSFHYFDWDCNLPIRCYLADLNDVFGHYATLYDD